MFECGDVSMNTTGSRGLSLRHTITPYVGVTCIGAVISVFTIVVLEKHPDIYFGIVSMTLLWSFVAINIFFGMYYRIILLDNCILQKAWGVNTISIEICDIKSIKLETGVIQKGSVHRPLRRISIYNSNSSEAKFIDISLKHFVKDDIIYILMMIKTIRSDLVLSAAVTSMLASWLESGSGNTGSKSQK